MCFYLNFGFNPKSVKSPGWIAPMRVHFHFKSGVSNSQHEHYENHEWLYSTSACKLYPPLSSGANYGARRTLGGEAMSSRYHSITHVTVLCLRYNIISLCLEFMNLWTTDASIWFDWMGHGSRWKRKRKRSGTKIFWTPKHWSSDSIKREWTPCMHAMYGAKATRMHMHIDCTSLEKWRSDPLQCPRELKM